MNKINQMLTLQQDLNDATNGINWENGITKNGKLIDWKRCTYLECAELIESYPWKHWKNIDASPDYNNIKIEAVDIWHFIMSQALKEYKLNDLGDINTLTKNIETIKNFDIFTKDVIKTTKNYYEQIEVVENLIARLFDNSNIEILIESFIEVAIQSELNLDTLYNLYVGKNILNKFRQDNGYKDGTYIKIWNNQEDNVIMQNILDSEHNITPTKLYDRLKEIYPKN
ncbi:Dimeric dUTPase [hydrothermal vent metagenome]|uniref:Dimeric dUTPase n=1 Tax=hydrothermal vent metagenome TaxID=652676 RepID=A0A1W1BLD1_9ZZZZ